MGAFSAGWTARTLSVFFIGSFRFPGWNHAPCQVLNPLPLGDLIRVEYQVAVQNHFDMCAGPQIDVLIAGKQHTSQSPGNTANSGAGQSSGDSADGGAHTGASHDGAAVSRPAIALDLAFVSRGPRTEIAGYAIG
jgi:hypothetical protein